MVDLSEKEPLTEEQQKAKDVLDEEIENRKKKLQSEIDALGGIDTEKIARRFGEKREQV